MKKSFLSAFLILFIPLFMNGQSTLPKVIPPSPQAQEFIKFIEYPMDYSSGLPSINVPLYTIRSKDLSLPISISYHASGLKPNSDESGIIGLGWHLNAGGIISRSISRKPDEKVWNNLIPDENDFSSNTNAVEHDPDANILDNLVRGYKESSIDIFNYSFPSKSGKFLFKRSTALSAFLNPVLLPYNPLKIIPNLQTVNGSNSFDYFEIIDENGVYYRFGNSISTTNDEIEYYTDINDYNGKDGITSWLLTEIISANKSDTISFEYNDVMCYNNGVNLTKTIHKSHRTFHKTVNTPSSTSHDWSGYYNSGGPSSGFNAYYYTQKKITKIKFKHGEVRFNYSSNIYPDCLLENIVVYSNTSSTPLQTIKLQQTKYHDNSGLLNWYKLDEVGYYSESTDFVKKYSFLYNQSTQFPSINDAITKETYSVDYWGFYNGATNSNSTLSQFSNQYISGTANRNPNAIYAKAGILTQIIYPTGGADTFLYEGNNANGNVGGLRLKEITRTSGTLETKRSFTYGGTSLPISEDYFMSTPITLYENVNLSPTLFTVSHLTSSSDPGIDINMNGRPVLYHTVMEYYGDELDNEGWVKHKFDISFVENYCHYHYPLVQPGYPLTGFLGPQTMPCYRNLIFGNIFEKETNIYDSSGNIKQITLNYYSQKLKQRLKGFTASRKVSLTTLQSAIPPHQDKVYFYDYYNYNIDQLSQTLDSTRTIQYFYDSNNAQSFISQKLEYTYNSKNQLIDCTNITSDGDLLETTFKYPGDINTGVYASMKNSNMLNYPIETTELVNAKVVGSKLTTYKSNSGGYVPDKVYTLETASPLSSFTAFNGSTKDSHYNSSKPEIKFEYYDSKGNPTQITNREGITTSYLWDNTGQYPMAKVEGATYSEVSSLNGKICSYNSSTLYNSLKSKVPGAMISTYSYKPLIGLAQQTDSKGTSTYYDYDAFGRLKNIRDDDEYITSRNYYHYYNQTTSDGEGDPGQPNPYFSVSPSIMRFGAYGGTQSFTIESNTDWTVTHSPGWVTLSKTSGSGNATIVVTCPSYSSPRSDGITIQSTYEGTHFSTGGLGVLQNR
nr:BACON domain-containing protein [uncultured Draconibacterium sp.]